MKTGHSSIRFVGNHRSTILSLESANAYCERVIGTIRRECLDYLIPLNARHLKRIVSAFTLHYNRGRPHTALGPGFPEPIRTIPPVAAHCHQLAPGHRVAKSPVLGGLHHEYRLEKEVA
jgi:putative transposase